MNNNSRDDLSKRLQDFYDDGNSIDQEGYFHLEDGIPRPNDDQKEWINQHLKEFKKLLSLKPGDRLVDLGSGAGFYSLQLSKTESIQTIPINFTISALKPLKENSEQN